MFAMLNILYVLTKCLRLVDLFQSYCHQENRRLLQLKEQEKEEGDEEEEEEEPISTVRKGRMRRRFSLTGFIGWIKRVGVLNLCSCFQKMIGGLYNFFLTLLFEKKYMWTKLMCSFKCTVQFTFLRRKPEPLKLMSDI